MWSDYGSYLQFKLKASDQAYFLALFELRNGNEAIVSAEPKTRRQGKKSPKTDFHFRMHDRNYDWLCEMARIHRVSVAKVLNAILFGKPIPNDFYLR